MANNSIQSCSSSSIGDITGANLITFCDDGVFTGYALLNPDNTFSYFDTDLVAMATISGIPCVAQNDACQLIGSQGTLSAWSQLT